MAEPLSGRVSVVIAAYNAAATVGETLDSVLAQTHTNIEVIVCDDASTDDTVKVVREYDDPRVLLLCNEVNLGPGPSRDRAIRHASGQWIALVDSDDVLHHDRIRRMLEAAGADRDVMVFDNLLECHHTPQGLVPWRNVRGVGEFGVREGESADVELAAWLSRPRLVMQPLIPVNTLRSANISYSKRRNVEDIEFYLAILATGLQLRYLAAALYYYRITPGSLSSNSQRWEGASQIHLNALRSFSNQPNVVAALKKKAREAEDNRDYRRLLGKVKGFRICAAILAILKKPRLVKLGLKKIVQDYVYNLHRNRHSGQSRSGDG